VCPIEKVTLRVVHGVPYRDVTLYGWSMVCPIEKNVTLLVVHGVLYREGYSMGDPCCTP